jgi:3-deoxy-7-phosphoheptulonate synthase
MGNLSKDNLNKSNLDLPIKQSDLNLVTRETKPENTIVEVSGIRIGEKKKIVIAGPCSVESQEQLSQIARAVKDNGAHLLRGGAFKPRTSPYSFQGLHDEGLKILKQISEEFDIPVVTEVMDPRKIDLVCNYADILQIGSRNMHNTPLLIEVGKVNKPVLLKRGMSATIEEFLLAAEYILKQGNDQVILCERGIRTFETSTRFTLDIGAIPLLKRISHLPVIVDPSHGTGHWWMVPDLAKAAIVAGADGLMIEVHHLPKEAKSDGVQSLKPEVFEVLMKDLAFIEKALDQIYTSPTRQLND